MKILSIFLALLHIALVLTIAVPKHFNIWFVELLPREMQATVSILLPYVLLLPAILLLLLALSSRIVPAQQHQTQSGESADDTAEEEHYPTDTVNEEAVGSPELDALPLLVAVKRDSQPGQFRVIINRILSDDLFIGVRVAAVLDDGLEKELYRLSAVILRGETESKVFDTQEWPSDARTVFASPIPFDKYIVSGLPCYVSTIGRDVLNNLDSAFQPYTAEPKTIIAL